LKQKRRLVAAAFVGLIAVLGGVLLRFPPEMYGFYPRCPFHEYLHLECPGCGGTRALAALLHGHLAEAVHWNALFVAVLPLLAGYGGWCCYRAWVAEEFAWPKPPKWVGVAGVMAALGFMVIRNVVAIT